MGITAVNETDVGLARLITFCLSLGAFVLSRAGAPQQRCARRSSYRFARAP